jgi:hypothetical protein
MIVLEIAGGILVALGSCVFVSKILGKLDKVTTEMKQTTRLVIYYTALATILWMVFK